MSRQEARSAAQLPRLCAYCAMQFHGKRVEGVTDKCDCNCHASSAAQGHEKHCGTSIGGPCDCAQVRERQYSGRLFAAQATMRQRLRERCECGLPQGNHRC